MRTNFLLKVAGFLLAVITPLLTLLLCVDVTEPFDKEIEIATEKAGGYIKGVCHADPDYELIKDANIGWFRDDIPFPYSQDGSLSPSYIAWKEYAKGYADNGIPLSSPPRH